MALSLGALHYGYCLFCMQYTKIAMPLHFTSSLGFFFPPCFVCWKQMAVSKCRTLHHPPPDSSLSFFSLTVRRQRTNSIFLRPILNRLLSIVEHSRQDNQAFGKCRRCERTSIRNLIEEGKEKKRAGRR